MPTRKLRLTHLDARQRPTMVDVAGKTASLREATAEAWIKLPATVVRELRRTGHRTRKGPVFDTAIVAGVMAAKKTHELIPFCHPLPLERCAVDISDRAGGRLRIVCQVAVHHKTGVEMEALVGASVAALTVYDMCKALSQDIEISQVRLLRKVGGKRDYTRKAATRPTRPRRTKGPGGRA